MRSELCPYRRLGNTSLKASKKISATEIKAEPPEIVSIKTKSHNSFKTKSFKCVYKILKFQTTAALCIFKKKTFFKAIYCTKENNRKCRGKPEKVQFNILHILRYIFETV